MTPNQYAHHKEQMEAHRRDFNEHWLQVIVPAMTEAGCDWRYIVQCQIGAWKSWLADARLEQQGPRGLDEFTDGTW